MRSKSQIVDPGAAVELEPGSVVGAYRIDSLVRAQPGMGTLYEAHGPGDLEVALSLVEPDLGQDTSFRKRFLEDARKRAEVRHPYFLDWYDAGWSDYGLFFATARVRGPTLASLIATNKLPPAASLKLLADVADGLEAAYEHGLVHRDLEPRNILFDSQDPGHPLLTDLGIGKPSGLANAPTESLYYLSPEEIRGEEIGCDSNVYSLACILYECLTGSASFPVEPESAILEAHLLERPPRATEQRDDLPDEIDAVIATGLAKEPQERYGSPVDLVLHAAEALAASPTALVSPPTGAIAPAPAQASPAADEHRVTTGEPTTAPRPELPDERSGSVPTDDVAPAEAPPPEPPSLPVADPEDMGDERPPPVARGRTASRVAVLAVAAASLGSVGFLFGTRANEADRVPKTVSSGGLQVRVPEGWRRRGTRQEIPGLAFDDPIAVGPRGDASAGLIAGRTRARDATLLPVGLRARLEGTSRRRDSVRLGDLEAYRYRGLRPGGYDKRLVLYSIPYTRGVVTAACFAGTNGPFLGECERIAATLSIREGRPLALGAGPAYRRGLDDVLRELRSRRATLRRELRRAKTTRGQAEAARGLARAYRSAARSLAAKPANAPARSHAASIVAALQGTGAAYGGLAIAARDGKRGAYDASREAIRDREAKLRKRIEALYGLG